jgi:hypothetical protein
VTSTRLIHAPCSAVRFPPVPQLHYMSRHFKISCQSWHLPMDTYTPTHTHTHTPRRCGVAARAQRCSPRWWNDRIAAVSVDTARPFITAGPSILTRHPFSQVCLELYPRVSVSSPSKLSPSPPKWSTGLCQPAPSGALCFPGKYLIFSPHGRTVRWNGWCRICLLSGACVVDVRTARSVGGRNGGLANLFTRSGR